MRTHFLIAALKSAPLLSAAALSAAIVSASVSHADDPTLGSPVTYLICSTRVTDPFSGLSDRVTMTFDNYPTGPISGAPGPITPGGFIYSGPHSSPATDGMLIGTQYSIDPTSGTITARYGSSSGPEEHLIQLVPVAPLRYKLNYRGPNGFMFAAENVSCFLNQIR